MWKDHVTPTHNTNVRTSVAKPADHLPPPALHKAPHWLLSRQPLPRGSRWQLNLQAWSAAQHLPAMEETVRFEPPHDKINEIARAHSEDSDQPGHPPSLIRVSAIRMKKVWVFSYPLSALRRLWTDWADTQADLSLCWAHSPFVGFVTRKQRSWRENTETQYNKILPRNENSYIYLKQLAGKNTLKETNYVVDFWLITDSCQIWFSGSLI